MAASACGPCPHLDVVTRCRQRALPNESPDFPGLSGRSVGGLGLTGATTWLTVCGVPAEALKFTHPAPDHEQTPIAVSSLFTSGSGPATTMIITVSLAGIPASSRPRLRAWCYANGFVANTVADTYQIDTSARTVLVERLQASEGWVDADFPEIARHGDGTPVSRPQVLPLLVELPMDILVSARHQAASRPAA